MAETIKRPTVQISILLVAFVVAYWIPLSAMAWNWWNNDDYSYAMIVPFASAYIVWSNRKTLAQTEASTSWLYLPFLLIFVAVSLYGILGSSGNASMPAIPILIVLFAGFCLGSAMLRRLILPLGFLIFMVPIPPILERTIGLWLKGVSTKLGGAIISALGVPVHVSGNVIDLGVTQLQVVDACSGLRYLFPLLALGVIYAYFFQKSVWKGVACVLFTIPLAVLANSFRIGATGLLSNVFGPGVADGFFHAFSGWILFLVCFAVLFLFGWGLSKIFRDKPVEETDEPQPAGHRSTDGTSITAFVVSLVLLAIVAVLSWSTHALPAVQIRGGIEGFPVRFESGWQGESVKVDPEIVDKSGAESAFSGTYVKDGQGVQLYMGYRSSAFLSNENFFHSPTVCLPSQGWKVLRETGGTVAGVVQFGTVPVSVMEMETMNSKELVYFWFQTKNRITADKTVNRFHLTLHALGRDNTHDLFIRTITPIYQNETFVDAKARMDQFVRDMMPVLRTFLKERQYEEKR